MICISCNTEINPKWKAAIDKNLCPFCGDVILDEKLKMLLSSLSQVMEDLSDFPSEIEDYLLCNFNYIKTNSEKLIDFVSPELLSNNNSKIIIGSKRVEKISDGKKEIDVMIEKNQSEQETSAFYARALNKKTEFNALDEVSERNNKLKSIADRIKTSGNFDIDSDDDPDVEGSESFDEEYSQVMQNNSSLHIDEEDLPSTVSNQIIKESGKLVPTSKADFEILRKMRSRQENAELSEVRPSFGSK